MVVQDPIAEVNTGVNKYIPVKDLQDLLFKARKSLKEESKVLNERANIEFQYARALNNWINTTKQQFETEKSPFEHKTLRTSIIATLREGQVTADQHEELGKALSHKEGPINKLMDYKCTNFRSKSIYKSLGVVSKERLLNYSVLESFDDTLNPYKMLIEQCETKIKELKKVEQEEKQCNSRLQRKKIKILNLENSKYKNQLYLEQISRRRKDIADIESQICALATRKQTIISKTFQLLEHKKDEIEVGIQAITEWEKERINFVTSQIAMTLSLLRNLSEEAAISADVSLQTVMQVNTSDIMEEWKRDNMQSFPINQYGYCEEKAINSERDYQVSKPTTQDSLTWKQNFKDEFICHFDAKNEKNNEALIAEAENNCNEMVNAHTLSRQEKVNKTFNKKSGSRSRQSDTETAKFDKSQKEPSISDFEMSPSSSRTQTPSKGKKNLSSSQGKNMDLFCSVSKKEMIHTKHCQPETKDIATTKSEEFNILPQSRQREKCRLTRNTNLPKYENIDSSKSLDECLIEKSQMPDYGKRKPRKKPNNEPINEKLNQLFSTERKKSINEPNITKQFTSNTQNPCEPKASAQQNKRPTERFLTGEFKMSLEKPPARRPSCTLGKNLDNKTNKSRNEKSNTLNKMNSNADGSKKRVPFELFVTDTNNNCNFAGANMAKEKHSMNIAGPLPENRIGKQKGQSWDKFVAYHTSMKNESTKPVKNSDCKKVYKKLEKASKGADNTQLDKQEQSVKKNSSEKDSNCNVEKVGVKKRKQNKKLTSAERGSRTLVSQNKVQKSDIKDFNNSCNIFEYGISGNQTCYEVLENNS